MEWEKKQIRKKRGKKTDETAIALPLRVLKD